MMTMFFARRLALIFSFALASISITACVQEVKLNPKVARREAVQDKSEILEGKEPIVFPDFSPSIPDGMVIYNKVLWNNMSCADCHGANGHGIGGKTRDMVTTDPIHDKPTVLYGLLAYGRELWDHPRLKDQLTDREIWDLVFACRSFATPPLSDQDLKEIEPVFGSNCADCHGPDGFGDGPLSAHLNPASANFHQFDRFYDREDEMILNHIREGLYPSAMPSFLGRKDSTNGVVFDESYVRKMVGYIRHFHVQNKPTDLSRDFKPVTVQSKP